MRNSFQKYLCLYFLYLDPNIIIIILGEENKRAWPGVKVKVPTSDRRSFLTNIVIIIIIIIIIVLIIVVIIFIIIIILIFIIVIFVVFVIISVMSKNDLHFKLLTGRGKIFIMLKSRMIYKELFTKSKVDLHFKLPTGRGRISTMSKSRNDLAHWYAPSFTMKS